MTEEEQKGKEERKMKKGQLVPLTLLVMLLLALPACAPQAAPTPVLAPTPGAAAPSVTPVAVAVEVPVKEPWGVEWEKLVVAAKREGRVVWLGTVGAEVRRAVTEAFGSKYGIKVEVIAGRASEVGAKIMSERRAGLYLADVMSAGPGPTTATVLKPAGALDPLEPVLVLPELTDPDVIKKTWWGGELLWVDKERTMLAFVAYPSGKIVVNTNLVKPGEIKSYRDLLDLKWKGKMTLNDPTVGGSGNNWFTSLAESIMDLDYLRKLAKQEPVILRDQRLQVEWLAQGKYPIAITPKEDIVKEFITVGAPLKGITPAEGAYIIQGYGSVLLINRAPHPHAAKLFINWLLSKEGVTTFSRAYGTQSARLDVPTDYIDPEMLRQPGIKYYSNITEEVSLKAAQYLKVAEEVFGEVLKR